MEGGERKEEASLPPYYVSLAQLQERWLRKQEERKLKEKQEEEDKRERDARAQNEKNQNQNENKNQRGCARMAGGIVRATGVVQDKGKGKEKKEMEEEITKKKKTKRKKRKFKGAGVVEAKGKVGVEAEALNGGDRCGGVEMAAGGAGILSGEGGSGGAISGVEEVGYVCVVEVSPRNGEIAHVKKTDLRGGFRKNSRNEGSRSVNELKQSEMALNMEKEKEKEKEAEKEKEKEAEKEKEKEKEGEKGCGMKWRERDRDRGRGRNGGYHERRINSVNEDRPVVLEGNEVDSKLETKVEDEISEVCSEISSLNFGDKNGIWGRDSKAKEDAVDGEGLNGDKVAVKIEKKVDHEVLTRKSENLGFGRGRRYTGPRVSDSGHRMKRRESVKVWVKKEDNLGS